MRWLAAHARGSSPKTPPGRGNAEECCTRCVIGRDRDPALVRPGRGLLPNLVPATRLACSFTGVFHVHYDSGINRY